MNDSEKYKPMTAGELTAIIIIAIIIISTLCFFIYKGFNAGLAIIPIILILIVIFIIYSVYLLIKIYLYNAERRERLEKSSEDYKGKIDYSLVTQFINDIASRSDLTEDISKLNRLPSLDKSSTLERVLSDTVTRFAMDDFIDDEEESIINDIILRTRLPKTSLDQFKWWDKYQKLLILKDIMNGQFPRTNSFSSVSNINLMKTERVVWVEGGVEYLEQIKRVQYVGRSSGLSIRIAKGIYYRVGAFKGTPVERHEIRNMGQGTLTITNKNIYFYSRMISIKIPFDKIISFTPYSDGLGIMKDGTTAKPQIFSGLDGWFIFNIVSNINALN